MRLSRNDQLVEVQMTLTAKCLDEIEWATDSPIPIIDHLIGGSGYYSIKYN
jgi:hypothetical protein